jgi:oxygen-independent coproporphyrinogen-3 oxidase
MVGRYRNHSDVRLPGTTPGAVDAIRTALEPALVDPPSGMDASHPSFTYYSPDPLPVGKLWERYGAIEKPHRALYVSVPFCVATQPQDCGFCLFPKVDLEAGGGRQAIRTYLGYLKRHLELLAPYCRQRRVDSVYIGGGTPNVLQPAECRELVAMIGDHVELESTAEVTFEGIPQLFTTREKFEALARAGVNRISIGVAQVRDDLIALSGRKQKRAQVEQAIVLCRELGFVFGCDLIFGWPSQSIEDALDDIRVMIDWQVPHLTVSPLRTLKNATRFSSAPYMHMIPRTSELIAMYLAIRDLLAASGYHQITLSDWDRAKPDDCETSGVSNFLHENWASDPLACDVIGVGYAAHTRILGSVRQPGFAFATPHDLGSYYGQLDRRRLPYHAGFLYNRDDAKCTYISCQLQRNRVRREAYRNHFGRDIVEEFADAMQAFLDLGWIEIDDDEVRAIELGVFFIAHIQRVLTEHRVAALERARRCAATTTERKLQVLDDRGPRRAR